jgi:hypothetical protein
LRFRRSSERWDESRVRRDLLAPLEEKFGASLDRAWFDLDGYETRRLEMDNGDFALFAWSDGGGGDGSGGSGGGGSGGGGSGGGGSGGGGSGGGNAYWLGNTETPQALWRTEKYEFAEAPFPVAGGAAPGRRAPRGTRDPGRAEAEQPTPPGVGRTEMYACAAARCPAARWAPRELLARLETVDPWLAEYEHLAWFFLPVFLSKDGRHTTRAFFREHTGGFPDADRDAVLAFFDDALATGVLDDHRYTMASKLGTSQGLDVGRMSATMAEFVVAKLLHGAGLEFEPEIELDSGYALDFRVGDSLVEVTRPLPPTERRRADSPVAAVRETTASKRDGQLDAHPGATLFVDCSSFRDDEWAAVRAERPQVAHRPTVVFRARPSGHVEGYHVGTLPFDLGDAVEWVD